MRFDLDLCSPLNGWVTFLMCLLVAYGIGAMLGDLTRLFQRMRRKKPVEPSPKNLAPQIEKCPECGLRSRMWRHPCVSCGSMAPTVLVERGKDGPAVS